MPGCPEAPSEEPVDEEPVTVTCGRNRHFEHEVVAEDHPLCDNCERCEDHCECYTCSGCSDRVESVCSRCEECYECCDCEVCDNCAARCDHTCNECNNCGDCCGGHEEDRQVALIDREITFHKGKACPENPSTRFVSLEVEVARSDSGGWIDDVAAKWRMSVVEDGSLPDSGFEVNTAPAGGDRLHSQLRELARALDLDGAAISADCGLHVHVDARDFGWGATQRLITVWGRIEEALFSVVPPSRRSTHYAQRCAAKHKNSGMIPDKSPRVDPPAKARKKIEVGLYGSEESALTERRSKYNSNRYDALNLHSWLYRGTFEIRLAAGTTQYEKMFQWAVLWAAIVDFCKTAKPADLERLPGESWACLKALAPTEACREWLKARRKKFATDSNNCDEED